MLKEYVVNLGLDALKDRLAEPADNLKVRQRLEKYIEIAIQDNFGVTYEEELDFGGLVEYIRGNFLAEVQKRVFASTKKERQAAYDEVVHHAVLYSRAHTEVQRERAVSLISQVMNLVRDFYYDKSNKGLRIVVNQAADDIIERVEEIGTNLKGKIESLEEKMERQGLLSLDQSIALLKEGDLKAVEGKVNDFMQHIGIEHPLADFYKYEMVSDKGQYRMRSVPINEEAYIQYPPKYVCTGTVKVGERFVKGINQSLFDYSYRHQVPITFNVKTAKKMLGVKDDPSTYDAEQMVGRTIEYTPEPFPEGHPYKLLVDGKVVCDYIWLRTEEITDDHKIIFSNAEQEKRDVDISFVVSTPNVELKTKSSSSLGGERALVVNEFVDMLARTDKKNVRIDFTFRATEPVNNQKHLKFLRILYALNCGERMSLISLEGGEIFIESGLTGVNYDLMFSSWEEDIAFFEKLVDIENFFDKRIVLPGEIQPEEMRTIDKLCALVRDQKYPEGWSDLNLTEPITSELRASLMAMEDKLFVLTDARFLEIELFEEVYGMQILHQFSPVRLDDMDKLKDKLAVLDDGDPIRIRFVPGEESGRGKSYLMRDNRYIEVDKGTELVLKGSAIVEHE